MSLTLRLQAELAQWQQQLLDRMSQVSQKWQLVAGRARDTTKASYELGEGLMQQRQYQDAKLRFKYCTWRTPHHIAAWRKLAECHFVLREWQEGREALQQVLRYDPQNVSAQFRLETLPDAESIAFEKTPPFSQIPPEILRERYVSMVDDYERIELGRKRYCGHMVMEAVLAPLVPKGAAKPKILDIGCGTGLCGSMIHPYAGTLIGVDSLSEMLESAKLSNPIRGNSEVMYHGFIEADAATYLQQLPSPQFGVISAANLLPDIGDIAPLLQGIAKGLLPGGYFLASGYYAENTAEKWMYHTKKQCFMHHAAYLQRMAKQAGLTAYSLHPAPLYNDDSEAGFMMILKKPANAAPTA